MASNAMCGFTKLSKANITDALALIGKKFDGDGNKTEMAEGLYDSMVAMAKDKKKLMAKVTELEQDIQNMQDCYY